MWLQVINNVKFIQQGEGHIKVIVKYLHPFGLHFTEMHSCVLFLLAFGVELGAKIDRKRVSRMWENAYLSIKNPRASRALKEVDDSESHISGVDPGFCQGGS